MLLLIISFLAGILTILAPCVLPVLPVIIGGSIGSDVKEKSRPYIIAASLAGSIIAFTLILKVSTVLIGLSSNTLNYISGVLVIGLGLAALFPEGWETLMVKLNWQAASQRMLGKGGQNRDKYLGGILVGVALGPVFASCSPTYAFILASILPHSFLSGLIYLIAYSLGLVLTLLLVSLLGIKYVRNFPWAVDTHSLFRRGIGLVFVVIGLVIITGHEVSVETWVAGHLPFDETRIERLLLTKQTGSSPIKKVMNQVADASVLNVQPTPAPELTGLTNWINSSPLTMSQLKGKVVLVDFWTYSCINCIRTLPHVEGWYQKYQSDGFVVLGINTPEFAFEHDPNNVAAGVKKYGITYPVALDNDYGTWNAYSNNSWPADYLIDQNGNVRYVSLGEGDYDKTEKAIQILLGVKKSVMADTSSVPISSSQTPETYFGTNRAKNYVGTPDLATTATGFTPKASLSSNEWTLGGKWSVTPESITSKDAKATLTFNVTAKDVYLVASGSGAASVSLPAGAAGQYGEDAPGGNLTINGSRLYHIVSLKQAGSTTVTLTVPAGVNLYTFTFGS